MRDRMAVSTNCPVARPSPLARGTALRSPRSQPRREAGRSRIVWFQRRRFSSVFPAGLTHSFNTPLASLSINISRSGSPRRPAPTRQKPGRLVPRGLPQGKNEGPHAVRMRPFEKSRRRPTFPPSCPGSIIGAGGLNFRVRDGNGCDPSAIVTGNSGTFAKRDTSLLARPDHDVISDLRKLLPPNHFLGDQFVQISVRTIRDYPFGGLSRHSRQPRNLLDPGHIHVHPFQGLRVSGASWNSAVRTALARMTHTNRIQDQHHAEPKNDCNGSHWRRRIANRVSHCFPNVWNQRRKMRSSLTAD